MSSMNRLMLMRSSCVHIQTTPTKLAVIVLMIKLSASGISRSPSVSWWNELKGRRSSQWESLFPGLKMQRFHNSLGCSRHRLLLCRFRRDGELLNTSGGRTVCRSNRREPGICRVILQHKFWNAWNSSFVPLIHLFCIVGRSQDTLHHLTRRSENACLLR